MWVSFESYGVIRLEKKLTVRLRYLSFSGSVWGIFLASKLDNKSRYLRLALVRRDSARKPPWKALR